MITIRFTVSGLPSGDQVNMRELKDEMALVLRRVLAIVAETQRDLKVLSILNVRNNRDATRGGGDKRWVYYDISVARRPNESFAPVVIAGLQDPYGELVEHFERYETMKFFGYGIDFYWCIQDDVEEGGDGEEEQPLEVAGVCSFTEEAVNADLKLAGLPKELDETGLVHHTTRIYRDLLQGIERLDIIDIEKEVMNVTSYISKAGEEHHNMTVFFDIRIVQKYRLDDFFGPAIHIKLQGSTNDILDSIRDYSDTQTNLTLNWYVTDEGAYAVRPEIVRTLPIAGRTLVIIALGVVCIRVLRFTPRVIAQIFHQVIPS